MNNNKTTKHSGEEYDIFGTYHDYFITTCVCALGITIIRFVNTIIHSSSSRCTWCPVIFDDLIKFCRRMNGSICACVCVTL